MIITLQTTLQGQRNAPSFSRKFRNFLSKYFTEEDSASVPTLLGLVAGSESGGREEWMDGRNFNNVINLKGIESQI